VSEAPAPDRFPTTHWSRVVRASDPTDREGQRALEQLCQDYWYPLYAFARKKGLNRDEAQDLVQGLLAVLIERRDLARIDPARGRFRSFPRTACEHHLTHRREHDRAAKRGGGKTPVSIDAVDAEGRYVNEPSHELTAERLFERRWARRRQCARIIEGDCATRSARRDEPLLLGYGALPARN
jgi:RNA polymerase sigma-70 factor (ECF subfamily)